MANTKPLVINQEYKDQQMSFGNVGRKKLFDMNQDELLELAILARKSNNKILTRCFTNLPPLNELVDEKVEAQQAAVTPPTPSQQPSKPPIVQEPTGKAPL